jgi:hypothetical protein
MGALWAPVLIQRFGGEGEPADPELGEAVSMPTWNWSVPSVHAYPGAFEKYYRNNFGFRLPLVKAYGAVMLLAFGVSSSDSVIVGKEGWYFYSGHQILNEDPRADFSRAPPLNDSQLRHWCEILQQRHDWLQGRGIRYLIMLIPNKSEIYPEFMPYTVRQAESQSSVRQLAAYLKANSTVPVLDVTQPLRRAKPWIRLYHKTDTHWNGCGGFIGYQEVIAAIRRWFPAMSEAAPITEFSVKEESWEKGELVRMINLKGVVDEETVYDLQPLRPRKAKLSVLTESARYPSQGTLDTGNTDLPRAVIFGDSFLGAFWELLGEHFEKSIYCLSYTGFPIEVIKTEQPDVVIEEILQRFLRDPVTNPPEVGGHNARHNPRD